MQSFRNDAFAVFYAILTILAAGIFLLDTYNNNANGRTPLLCLYFALLFLNYLYESPVGYYSEPGSRMDLSFLYGIYIAPLYLFLSPGLKTRWKYPLCVGITVWASLCLGNFEPAISAVADIAAYTTLIMVTVAIVRRTMQTRQTMDILRERRRLTEENYHQMELRLQNTALMRHEWKNQVTSLRLLAEQGKFSNLKESLKKMDNHLAQLSMARYSDNYTVNVLLQNTAARALELGLAFIKRKKKS